MRYVSCSWNLVLQIWAWCNQYLVAMDHVLVVGTGEYVLRTFLESKSVLKWDANVTAARHHQALKYILPLSLALAARIPLGPFFT